MNYWDSMQDPAENALQPEKQQATQAPAFAAEGAAERPHLGPLLPKGHVKTAGEHKFDQRVYRNIGYYANVAISLVAVYWAERTKPGQALIKGLGAGFEKIGVSRKAAEYLGTKSFFLAGGFAVMPPMKWREDKKAEQVHQYNRETYGEKAETDPVILQSEKEIAEAPKQGWKSILSARALALVPFYAGYALIWGHDSPLAKLTKGHAYVDRPIVWASRKLGTLGAKTMGHGEALAKIEELAKASPGVMKSLREFVSRPGHDPMHSTGPYYFISEAITSAMVAWGVYVITRITGPFFGRKQQEQVIASPPEAAPQPPIKTASMALQTEKEPEKGKQELPPVTQVHMAQAESRLANPALAAQV
jgi:hypothetical protein